MTKVKAHPYTYGGGCRLSEAYTMGRDGKRMMRCAFTDSRASMAWCVGHKEWLLVGKTPVAQQHKLAHGRVDGAGATILALATRDSASCPVEIYSGLRVGTDGEYHLDTHVWPKVDRWTEAYEVIGYTFGAPIEDYVEKGVKFSYNGVPLHIHHRSIPLAPLVGEGVSNA